MTKIQEITVGWTNYVIRTSKDRERVAKKRLSICFKCDYFNKKTKICKKCGCFMFAKVRCMSSKCKEGYW